MKKGIIVLAVLIPAFLAGGCMNQGNKNAEGSETVTQVKRVEHSAGQIVYIHLDSLLTSYRMALDLTGEFQKRYEKAESEMATKQGRFEKEYIDYQEKAQKGLATRLQLEEIGRKLQIQEQQLRQDAEKLMAELSEEEQVINNKIYFAITDYLKELNSDNRYGMIISTNTSGPILNADPNLSITKIVLDELNKRYDKEKSGK